MRTIGADLSAQQRIHVAVGVVFNEKDQVLWAQRPEGKPYAGYWEFPGGKLESHETPEQALVRELQEELGISVQHAAPWFYVDHDYPHAKVRLHLMQVRKFTGTPKGLEGQRWCWANLLQKKNVAHALPHSLASSLEQVAIAENTLEPILPATIPMLPRMAQAPLMAIIAAPSVSQLQNQLQNKLQHLLHNQPKLLPTLRIQFREKQIQGLALQEAFKMCAQFCAQHGIECIVNSDTALQLLREGHAAVAGYPIHLTAEHLQHMLHASQTHYANPHHVLTSHLQTLLPRAVGAAVHSAHNLNELAEFNACLQTPLQYAVLGWVHNTPSHPGQPGMGWGAFRALVAQSPVPVYAIGGIHPNMLHLAQSHGAHGVASLSGFLS